MKTDILIEPEVKGSEQLYKEIYIVIHTAYIVYTMQLKCSTLDHYWPSSDSQHLITTGHHLTVNT